MVNRNKKIEILFEDEDLLICHKPSGLLVIPDRFHPEIPCLHHQLKEIRGEEIRVVHRIDRETSGLVCFAKSESSHRYLSRLWENRQVEKHYLGLVHGIVRPAKGRIEKPILELAKGKMTVHPKGKAAITDYETLTQWSGYAWISFRLVTGRTHQIRVHMQSAGHPLVGDALYGRGDAFYLSRIKKNYAPNPGEYPEKPLLSRLALHASGLKLLSPQGKPIEVESPLPKDLKASLAQLNKWQTVLD